MVVQSNYDILGVPEGCTQKDIRDAFRRMALQMHSDRGGDSAEFIRIKEAYEGLKVGKKYPDTPLEKLRHSKVFSGDANAEVRRRNKIIGQEIDSEMRMAGEWAMSVAACGMAESRVFGSKTLGEMEFDVKADRTLHIKGNYMAGRLIYDGPILLQGSVYSPSWADEYRSVLVANRGNIKVLDPTKYHFRVENGAALKAANGNVVVGNVYGRKQRVDDPDGRVGVYTTREYRTRLLAPRGHVVAADTSDTVLLEGDTVIVLNMENDVRVVARHILIYGSRMTYDCTLRLRRGGTLRFFEDHSVLGLSGDVVIKLEGGKSILLRHIKSRRIRDLPADLVEDPDQYDKNATMVGGGFTITYDMLNTI